jgi:hypothetical protein
MIFFRQATSRFIVRSHSVVACIIPTPFPAFFVRILDIYTSIRRIFVLPNVTLANTMSSMHSVYHYPLELDASEREHVVETYWRCQCSIFEYILTKENAVETYT